MLSRVLLVVALLAAPAGAQDAGDDLAAIAKAAPACDSARAHCVPIQIHVATGERGPVASAEWIANQLASANRHFAPLDLGFQLAGVDALPAGAAHLETRADRNAIARGRLAGRVIHVFVVARLDDVDVEGAVAYGVTWRLPKDRRKFIIVSAQAWPRTLAHELGHFFGLPHSTYAISIMNKAERAEPPVEQRTFADEEIAAMRPRLTRLLRDRVIVAIARRPTP